MGLWGISFFGRSSRADKVQQAQASKPVGRKVILEKVIAIVAKVFGVDKSRINEETEWNKLNPGFTFNHVLLIVDGVEKEFKIHIPYGESSRFTNVKNVVDIVLALLTKPKLKSTAGNTSLLYDIRYTDDSGFLPGHS